MTKTIKPTTDLDGIVTLDMRVSPALGKDLYDEIEASIRRQQLFIKVTLPSVLVVTQKQFASLHNYTEEMLHTSDRFMVTSQNAMEVTIDRDIDTVDEIETTMELTDELNQAKEDIKATRKEADGTTQEL